MESVAAAIRERSRRGKSFSIVAIAEGALSLHEHSEMLAAKKARSGGKQSKKPGAESAPEAQYAEKTVSLAKQLELLTGLESRITGGHLQRGGTPSAADRLLSTRLGTACAALIDKGQYGVMVAARGDSTEAVLLEEVAGKIKTVPPDHPWVPECAACRDLQLSMKPNNTKLS